MIDEVDIFRFNKLTLDTDEGGAEDGETLVLPRSTDDVGLLSETKKEKKTTDQLSIPKVSLRVNVSPTSPSPQPPLAFLNETKTGEEKPAILKLLDTNHISSSSILMSSLKVGLGWGHTGMGMRPGMQFSLAQEVGRQWYWS